jgi:hypothetical protein
MAVSGFWSVVLLILQILMFLSVIVTFILVVKIPSIKMKTKAASIGVTFNGIVIALYFILKYLILGRS